MAERFAECVTALEATLSTWRSAERLVEVDLAAGQGWPSRRGLVLGADAALDLGSPAVGSLAFLLWSAGAESRTPRRAWRLGPDVPDLAAASREAGLGLVIHVRGEPAQDSAEEYTRYIDLRQALYSITPDGVTLRSMPSQQHLWLRIHRDAVARGFTLAHLGATLSDALLGLPFAREVGLLFVTAGPEALAPLRPLAQDVHRRVGALVKRHEEERAECDECEYQDICDEKEHRT